MTHAIRGVYAAAATPVSATGAFEPSLFVQHCKALLDEGCHGIALLGTTGEANSFGVAERKSILETALSGGIAPSALLPGASMPSVADTIELVGHAVSAGVKGVLLLPPYYYKGVSEEGLFRFYARVIEAVGSDALRVVLYHIPQVTQVPIPHDLIARLMDAFPGIVCGIKDSSGDLDNMKAMAARFPDLGVLAGADPLMLPLLKSGGAGCITANANLRADALRFIWDNWESADMDDRVEQSQSSIVEWRTLSNRFVQLSTVKAMLARKRGSDVWLNLMPPHIELPEEQREIVWAEMQKLGC